MDAFERFVEHAVECDHCWDTVHTGSPGICPVGLAWWVELTRDEVNDVYAMIGGAS